MNNPIASSLNIEPAAGKQTVTIAGRAYELYSAHGDTVETLYRVNPGMGAPNPGFTLHMTPATHHKLVLGQYFARPRDGVKRAEAEAIVDAARAEVGGR